MNGLKHGAFRSFPRKRESREPRSGLWVPAFAGTSGGKSSAGGVRR